MASFPVLLNPSNLSTSTSASRRAWIAAGLGILFVACTSNNLMGGAQSQAVINSLWHTFLGQWHMTASGPVNLVLRKVGHYLGHGAISLLFLSAWYGSIRRALPARRSACLVIAAALAVLTSFSIASLDEWHQSFLPGRVGCFRDVLIDTAGALTFNVARVWSQLRTRGFRRTSFPAAPTQLGLHSLARY